MGTALGARHMSTYFDGAIPNTDAMRGKNGVVRAWRSHGGGHLALDYPLISARSSWERSGSTGAPWYSTVYSRGRPSPDAYRCRVGGLDVGEGRGGRRVRQLRPGMPQAGHDPRNRKPRSDDVEIARSSMPPVHDTAAKELAGAARRAPDRPASAADRAPGCCQRWRDGWWMHALTAWPTHAPSLMGWRQASGASPRRWRWLARTCRGRAR